MRTFRARGEAALGVDILRSPFTDRVGSICDREFIRDCMRGARAVLHTATLHKPHVATHSKRDFVDTNVTGTLVLLEEAVAAGVEAFVYTSTTSAFGGALTGDGIDAAWITEDVRPIPKNIYGVTKVAAEDLCELVHLERRLPVIVLRTARFFPEEDDNAETRATYTLANAQGNEMSYRRVDIADVVAAHELALEKAVRLGFGRYIISATTPFAHSDLPELGRNAPAVLHWLFPTSKDLYAAKGWTFFPRLDRVYVNRAAVTDLEWQPQYDFKHVLACLAAGTDFRSPLALEVGSKGYHDRSFAEGPYPVV